MYTLLERQAKHERETTENDDAAAAGRRRATMTVIRS